ncbi:YciI family protein [Sneathiella limimaris]|uniref:YciI family protein n=1 Tax=Sneathiella limimaris TaxID=1964213 RepID=UPI001469EC4C
MLFIAYCIDKKDHLQVRMDNRPAHLEFLKAKGDELKAAGPTTTEDGSGMTGSLLIFEAESLEAAQEWAAQDPYGKAGLFERVDVKPWKHVLGSGLSS